MLRKDALLLQKPYLINAKQCLNSFFRQHLLFGLPPPLIFTRIHPPFFICKKFFAYDTKLSGRVIIKASKT